MKPAALPALFELSTFHPAPFNKTFFTVDRPQAAEFDKTRLRAAMWPDLKPLRPIIR
jgi:hypothetical protein